MTRRLKRLVGELLLRWLEVNPRLFVPWSITAREVEIRIVGNQVWVDTEEGCQFRAKARDGVTVTREEDLPNQAGEVPAAHKNERTPH